MPNAMLGELSVQMLTTAISKSTTQGDTMFITYSSDDDRFITHGVQTPPLCTCAHVTLPRDALYGSLHGFFHNNDSPAGVQLSDVTHTAAICLSVLKPLFWPMLLPQLLLQQMLLLMQQSWKQLPEKVPWGPYRSVGVSQCCLWGQHSQQTVLWAVESQKQGVKRGFAAGLWLPCFADSKHGVPLDCRSLSKQASNFDRRVRPIGPVLCIPQ